MKDLLKTVEDFIIEYNMLEKGDRIVAGISGGPDSMCMLHILINLMKRYELVIYATHLNHQFRGKDADEDAAYVENICKKWGIPFFLKVFDVPSYAKEKGMSAEEAGRIIRYGLYEEVLEKTDSNKIAVAHNLNDHIETVLMNLLRGSGVEGLKGIEGIRGNIIRPLINTKREDIERYCVLNEIEPRIDKTNLEPIYGRNKIRLGMIPYINDNFNPNILDTLGRFSNIASEENDFVNIESQKAFIKITNSFEDGLKYSIIELNKLHKAIKRRVIRIGLEKIIGSLKGIEYKHIEDIISISKGRTGKAVVLPKNIRAYVSYDELVIRTGMAEKTPDIFLELKTDCINHIPILESSIEIEKLDIKHIKSLLKAEDEVYIDMKKLTGKVVARNRMPGDIFFPFGSAGSKKLKDYFIDEKIPKEERDSILLIADGKEIIWIPGKRLSEKYKITENTKEAFRMKFFRG